jgi:hypothetical protein
MVTRLYSQCTAKWVATRSVQSLHLLGKLCLIMIVFL